MLAPGDEPALARFFATHPDTTLFFQGNLRDGGLVDRGEPCQGTWVAAFERGALAGLAVHFWNDNLLLEAPRQLERLVAEAVRASQRPVSGLLGTRAQVVAARAALGLERAPTFMDSTEDLFALPLAALRVPEPLARGELVVRAPGSHELDALVAWRHAYRVETIGERPGPALLAKSREELERYQRQGRHFVLVRGDEPLSYAAFNAETPDCVQIGGVWTPHALRGRGYARAAVAGALLAARRRGIQRSVLFTETDNAAAQSAYRALGYERVGDYAIVLFAEPGRPNAT